MHLIFISDCYNQFFNRSFPKSSTLESLRFFIIATNNEIEANQYLTKFSTLMRGMMENFTEDFIPFLQVESSLLLIIYTRYHKQSGILRRFYRFSDL